MNERQHSGEKGRGEGDESRALVGPRLVKKASHALRAMMATPSPVSTALIATKVRLAVPRDSTSSSTVLDER